MASHFAYWPEGLNRVMTDKFRSEDRVISELLEKLDLSLSQRDAISAQAETLVGLSRERKKERSLLDAFMSEYGLANEEGIALMCLAEALLRVPDADTRDALIADKLAPHDWSAHLGQADTVWVNAATWGLLLTGRVTALSEELQTGPKNALATLTDRLGEPVIRKAVMSAMRIMGTEFVQGETISKAIKNGRKRFGKTQGFSYDMLGEGARTQADAERYLAAYKKALDHVAKEASGQTVRQGISVKLSALSPHYNVAHWDRAVIEVGDIILDLAKQAIEAQVDITLDAEEADRLELSLAVFDYIARKLPVNSGQHFGLAVQAYGRRASRVIDWIVSLGRTLNQTFHMRLVKGAYWDAEIKHAQAHGHPDFPVFTRKPNTDVSYLACAKTMLEARDVLHCQFATHNAHTIAAVMSLADNRVEGFEFQRLFGMGEIVYGAAKDHFENLPPVRIYAPVGGHKDLLAYLVRRLLENGANSSFVNHYLDPDVPVSDVVRDPIGRVLELDQISHPAISPPSHIFMPERLNSSGLDLSWKADIDVVSKALVEGLSIDHPSDTDPAKVTAMFEKGVKAYPSWSMKAVHERASCLTRVAEALEAEKLNFLNLLVNEAGKTWGDANDEVREAVDFCRYYAAQAQDLMASPQALPGPVGEANQLTYGARGVFVCISPWNFPLAIFLGQIVAALVAGNCVIAKPAEQTPRIAKYTVDLLHAAGIPNEVLQIAFGGGLIGAALTAHEDVAGVAFTGSTQTARLINITLAEKDGPIVPLIAETGGQNVMIVDGTALPEQVVDDVIGSAFLSAGQRCSALRVLYLQDDIADTVLTMLKGAMDDLVVGHPTKLSTDIGPVIDETAENGLAAHIRSLKTKKFRWHVTPAPANDLPQDETFILPHLFEIKTIDILHKEHFGPVLHVIRYKAKDLPRILQEAFSSGYGLTLGVHTRIDHRWRQIAQSAPVGNIYINRNMVGAVVGSQPFGGQGLSGTGFKAGGPNYLLRFMTEKTLSVNTTASGGNAALLSL